MRMAFHKHDSTGLPLYLLVLRYPSVGFRRAVERLFKQIAEDINTQLVEETPPLVLLTMCPTSPVESDIICCPTTRLHLGVPLIAKSN